MPLENRTCFIVNLRDRLACQRCGVRPQVQENYHRGFEYHHIMPRSLGGSDAVENIILLCHDCHGAHHGSQPLIKPDMTVATTPQEFACKQCAATLDTATVTMNCGWYQCNGCNVQTHLFQHFEY